MKKKSKKPIKFDPNVHYIEDMDNLNRFEILLTIPSEPIWYRTMLACICLESFYVMHEPIIYYKDPYNVTQKNITVYEDVFNLMYLLDVAIMLMAMRLKFLPLKPAKLINRPLFIILCEMISTLPLEHVYRYDDHQSKKYFYLIKLIRTLKLLRLLHHFYRNKFEFKSNYKTRLLELLILLALTQSVFVLCFHIIHCMKRDCARGVYATVYEVISTKVLGKGLVITYLDFYEMTIWNYDLSIIGAIVLAHMWILKPMICYMINGLIADYEHKVNYIYKVNFFKNKLAAKYGMSENTCKSVMEYFQACLKHRGGFTNEEVEKAMSVYSCSMRIEMSMDIGWVAFKHSGIFRNREVYFLRFLTTLMKVELHMPGEFLYERNVMKKKLIYIAEGIVDVISDENGKCGIFSLTAGSCLGESTLFIPYKSNVNFRCQTVCRLYVLANEDFVSIQTKYPYIYKILLNQILDRFLEAKSLHNEKLTATGADKDLVRLKTTLHGLMAKGDKYKAEHQIKNIYLANDLNFTCMNQRWNTRKYLDLLVLKDRCQTQDSVFIKSTGIWILHPTSPILKIWDYFIVFQAVVCLALIPFSIYGKNSTVTTIILWVIQIIWLIDLLMQWIIPINEDSDARTVLAILVERCRSVDFKIDLLSVFPGKVFSVFCPPGFNREYLELNKLVKLYRFLKLYNEWESQFKNNRVYLCLFKYFCILALQIFLVNCAFLISGLVDSLFSPMSVQYACGVGYLFIYAHKNANIIYMICNNTALIMELVALVSITAVIHLNRITKLKVRNFIENLLACVKKQVKNPEIMQRLESFINTQINENEGMMVITNFKKYFDLPVYFDIITKSEYHLKYLLKLEMFADIPIEILQKLTTTANIMIFHKHANIVNRGVIYSEVFVLISGRCRTICGKAVNFTKPFVPINMLEICYGTPAVCTVIGVTEVMMLTFNYKYMMMLLKSENVRLFANFQNAFNIKKEQTTAQLVKILKGVHPAFIAKTDEQKRSFYVFQERNIRDSYTEFDYYVPFDRYYILGVFRYLLMPLTIYPEGAFMLYWDLGRCILAFLSSVSHLISPLSISPLNSYFHLYLYVLDISAIFDIYIRMHVSYYNDVGILIKHPLYTAGHYFKHGFLGDIFGAIPFNLINTNNLTFQTVLNLLRSIQLFRVIGFKLSCRQHSFYINIAFTYLWIIVLINTTSSISFAFLCSLEDYKFSCVEENDPVELFVYIFFMHTSIITTTGLEGAETAFYKDRRIEIMIAALSVVGIIIKVVINSYLLSYYLKKDLEIYKYRTGLKNLFRWMKKEKCSKYTRGQIRMYYNMYWKRVGNNNPYQNFEHLNKSLKRDLLYHFYGAGLVEHNIFTNKSENASELNDLYKNFLLEMAPLIIPRNGYVYTINDVEKNVYFLYSGDVEVVAADGTCLTRLDEGSLFGNLDNQLYSRQKISIVANTHVQLFYLNTQKFYAIIEYFPDLKANFLAQKSSQDFYIKSQFQQPEQSIDIVRLRKGLANYKKFRVFKLFYEIGLYINLLMQIYQLAVLECSFYYVAVQCAFDALHIAYEVMKFCFGYLDENHDLIIDPVLIRKRYMQRLALIISLVSSVPSEVLFLIMASMVERHDDSRLILCLLNRLLRVKNMMDFHNYRYNNFPCNSRIIQSMLLITYELILTAALMACVLIHLDRNIPDGGIYFPNIYKGEMYFYKVPVDLKQKDKFNTFIKYFYFHLTTFIFTNDENYATNSTVKLLFIIGVMIFWSIVHIKVLAAFMELMCEETYPRNVMLRTIKYYEYYTNLRDTSNIIKKMMYCALVNMWNSSHDKNIMLLTSNSPRYLKQAILYQVYGHVLYTNPIFHHTHIDFLRQLIEKVQIVLFFTNDIIVYKNDDRETIYFIHDGNVAVLVEESDYNGLAVETLGPGDCFGLMQGLFSNRVYDYTYRAMNACSIVQLELKTWAHLLEFFPATREYIYTAVMAYENASSCRKMPKKNLDPRQRTVVVNNPLA